MLPAPSTTSGDPLVGQLFAGRYRITRLISRGEIARVYVAEQVPGGRAVALKVLASCDVNKYRDRFLREAAQLSRLSHPNTVRVLDHGVEGDQPFIAMEYIEGPTLHALLADTRLDPVRAVRIARQICGSLGEAHDLGLIHRDLKPANVLVARGPHNDDLVQVVDFGLVKEVEDAVHTTGEGIMVGTPMFMAPEQIRGQKLDQRCDVYALGVLLYRAITGYWPFPDKLPSAVMMSHLNDPPARFATVAPELELPDCVEWTVMRCLEKDRDARFVTVKELQRALKLCEAALLDPATAPLTHLGLADGRVVLPEAIYGRTAPPRSADRERIVRYGGIALMVGTLMAAATVFGFVVARGVHAAMDPITVIAPAVTP
jgi:eukaryotic-like serine/threonine-protein kinase